MPAYPFEEHLLWIMDDKIDSKSCEENIPDRSVPFGEWTESNRMKEEERLRKTIDLVHALGLKCDSVGWCSLDLGRPDIDALLERIHAFVLNEGYYLRGIYTRQNADFDSEWYLLESTYLSNGEWNYANVTDRDGNPLTIDEVCAYKIPRTVQVIWNNPLPHVNEKFRDCCLKHGFSGVDFYWIRDIGRYHAAQFFGLIIDHVVPEFACDRYLTYSDSKDYGYKNFDHSAGSPLYRKYQALGGRLPKLSQMFYDLRVHLPIQLPKNKMPATDFACVYFYRGDYSSHYALIRKHAAEKLLAEKVIRNEYLTPVVLYEDEPAGYHIQTSEPIPYPSREVVRQLNADYAELKQNPKPERKASEKDALKLFRAIKKLRPEDFKKALAQKTRDTLTGTPYEPLIPYYAISDGGSLSDEYEFLSYAESLKETRDYAGHIEKEELLAVRHTGIAIARCADGDIVILRHDGSVKRISHETMDVYESWDTAAQFFYDALSEA
ncbi:Uncharacterized protein TXXE_07275 [Thermobacillus xylanilyticus]|uniref:Uncharacterized protein n=1 Tax=Thermobacillus xylanilyticus TaxID=76633 RepID=A0ABN7RQS7_THEXY|nr:hypothetical protein [Thermobacillus xylanilyticus]CAG5083896.1 Uncharacterized protein TXXE_07275 [Thermobacillus xylanilyticus]